jgi:hypothetical protein
MESTVLNCLHFILSEYKEIIISVIAVIGVFITAFVALRNNSKNLLIKTVTDERARWRIDLRNSMAEFAKLVHEHIHSSNSENMSRIIELKAHIKMRTNPSDCLKHILDQQILKESQEIVDLIKSEMDINMITSKLLRLETNVQKLLKQEWDKSKGEADSGKLAK